MKFLFLFSTSTLTGQAAQAFNILSYLIRKGHSVWAITDQSRCGDLDSYLNKSGASIIKAVSVSNKNKLVGKYKEILGIRSAINEIRPDFVVSSFSNDHFTSLIAIRSGYHRPGVIRFFHSKKIRGDFIHRKLFYNTDLFIFYDSDLFEEFKKIYPDLGDKLHILPTSIDINLFVPRYNVDKRRFGFDRDNFVIGYVGMFQKGRLHRELIDAFARYKERDPKARLLLVGGGETLKDIEKYALQRCKSNEVRFTGFVDTDLLIDAYNVMDIFVLLKGGHDTSLRMLYEAQSCGTYILTYESFPSRRLLDMTNYGNYIKNVYDSEEICNLLELSKNCIKRDIRDEIHRRVAENFSIEKAAEKFVNICKTLI